MFEELTKRAKECNIPIVTATQLSMGGICRDEEITCFCAPPKRIIIVDYLDKGI